MTPLNEPLEIGSLTLENRLYRAPVLEGAGSAKDPAQAYAKHFVPNAEAGVGLIIQGNTIVLPEGRTSPGMSAIAGRQTMHALRPLTEGVHAAGGRIVIQLGHGGIFSLESWHREFRAARTRPPLAPGRPPLWLRPFVGRVHPLSKAEVEELIERFGLVARWAREAGYDGVQLAGANAKLLHQFLSPTYNRRKDRFGGSPERRFALLAEIRQAIARQAGADYPVLLKYPAVERAPLGRGIRLEEGLELARLAEAAGFDALTPVQADVLPNTAICRGDFPLASLRNQALAGRFREASDSRWRYTALVVGLWLSSRRYPFEPVWNRPVFEAVKRAVSIPVFAVGGIRTAEESNDILASGAADLIGIGRPFYAEPDLAQRFLGPPTRVSLSCESCNRCLIPQMLGMPGVCYNPEVNRKTQSRRRQPQPV